jgi:hypothetical protein
MPEDPVLAALASLVEVRSMDLGLSGEGLDGLGAR